MGSTVGRRLIFPRTLYDLLLSPVANVWAGGSLSPVHKDAPSSLRAGSQPPVYALRNYAVSFYHC